MRYQGRTYKSQSFAQTKHNKQNSDTNNLPNLITRENNPPNLQKKISDTTAPKTIRNQIIHEDIKVLYTKIVSHHYSKAIFNHLLIRRQDYQGFLANHQVTPTLRSKMVDWMIEVLSSYKMSEETFFRSVSIMDLYLKMTHKKQQLKDLHLIGVTSMLIASKYEQIHPFKVSVIYDKIGRKKFTKQSILQKQSQIISTLDFQIQRVNIYDYIRHCLNSIDFYLESSYFRYFEQINLYLAKMTLFSCDLVEESQELLAAAVIYISLKTLQQTDSTVQPEKILPLIGIFFKIEDIQLIETSRKVLDLAKNFSKIYPSLGNLKKFNKFQYQSQ